MTLTVPPIPRATMVTRSEEVAPDEACGLLLGVQDRVLWAECIPNRHPEPRRHFRMIPVDLAPVVHRAIQLGIDVLGNWHSHPTGQTAPSAADCADTARVQGAEGELVMVIVGADGEMRAWRVHHGRPIEVEVAFGHA